MQHKISAKLGPTDKFDKVKIKFDNEAMFALSR
jgi:hypothetical protein